MRWVHLLAIATLTAGTGCAGSDEPSTTASTTTRRTTSTSVRRSTTTTTGPGMTRQRMLNLDMPEVCDLPATRWVDGRHPASGQAGVGEIAGIGEGKASEADDLQVRIGDLTGDGVDDGVLIAACTFGGNATYVAAYGFDDEGGSLGRIPAESQVPSDRRIGVGELTLTDGAVGVVLRGYDDEDPNCCPSIVAAPRFRHDGTAFVAVPATGLSGTLSPGGLGRLQLPATPAVVSRETGLALRGESIEGGVPADDECGYWSFLQPSGARDERVSTIGNGLRVESLTVSEKGFRTAQGTTVGSTLDEVVAAHPGARRVDNIYLDIDDVVVDGPGGRVMRYIFDQEYRIVSSISVGTADYALAPEGCA